MIKKYFTIPRIENYTKNPEILSGVGLSQYLAMLWMFPGVILGLVLSAQPELHSLFVPRLIIIINDLAATIIVLTVFRTKICLVFFIGSIVILKILAYATVSPAFLYALAVNLLFAIATSAILFKRPVLFYRQLMVISLLNLVFMILQVLGIAEWSQFLTTHGSLEGAQQWSLFAKPECFSIVNVQARPAGILHSNIIVSGFVMLAAVHHFSRERGGAIIGSIILCVTVALAMAKVAFIGFFLTLLIVIIMGNQRQKNSSVWGILILVCTIYVYRILFPALYAHNLSFATILYSFELRINEILRILPDIFGIKGLIQEYINPRHNAYWSSGYVSGVTVVLKYWKMLMIVLLVVMPIYFRGRKRLKLYFPRLSLCVLLSLVVAIIYPFAFPIWVCQLYGVIVGGACLSFFVLLRPFNKISPLKGKVEPRSSLG